MGQRVIAGSFPAPSLWLSWHDEPYGDPSDCWGCGNPTDQLSPVFHGLPQMPGHEPPSRPECTWCAELAAILDAMHTRKWVRRGYSRPPRKPKNPPRGGSGISPGPGGVR